MKTKLIIIMALMLMLVPMAYGAMYVHCTFYVPDYPMEIQNITYDDSNMFIQVYDINGIDEFLERGYIDLNVDELVYNTEIINTTKLTATIKAPILQDYKLNIYDGNQIINSTGEN